ncbi:hypothetical protein SRHO_G00234850 [Serrasalmus rhombeus]
MVGLSFPPCCQELNRIPINNSTGQDFNDNTEVLHFKRKYCNHKDEERALTGSWCSVVVMKALEKGYRVMKVFEIWHFPNQADELFADYIKMFLKTKQESSGYPSWLVDESSKKEYVQKYEENEGIKLDESCIVVNPGKRCVAKLALNSQTR